MAHPGHYLTTVYIIAATCNKQSLKYKTKTLEYDLCAGVINNCKNKIVKAANEEYLKEICDKIIGFQNLTVVRILEHLKERRGKLITLKLKKYKKNACPLRHR